MRCGNVKVDGEEIWIPGCEGGAWGGKNNCTCYKPITKGKRAEQTIENLENELRAVRAINEKIIKQNRELKVRNNELARCGLPLKLRRKLDSSKDVWLDVLSLLRKIDH